MKSLYKIGLALAGLSLATSCDYEPLSYEVEKPATIVTQEEIDAYSDLKTLVNKDLNPGFKLGAVLGLTDYNQMGLNYRILNRNFDELTPGVDFKHGSIVQANGSLNLANVKTLLETAQKAEISVFGHALTSHTNQNVTYLNGLIAPLSVKNPIFTNVLSTSGLDNGTFTGWSRTNPGAGISVISEGSNNVKSVKLVAAAGSASPEALQLVSPEISIDKSKPYDVVFYIKSNEPGEGRVSFEGLNNNTPALDYTESGKTSATFTTDRGWKKITFRITDFQSDKIRLRFDLGYKSNVTYFLNVPTLYMYNPQESFFGSSKMWLEAEDGTAGNLWDVLSNTSASNNRYITIKAGNNSTGGATTDPRGLINYNFTISTAGTYALWARVAVTVVNGADDSFFFRLDNGTWVTFNGVANNTAYTWYKITDSPLTSGNHTLTVSYREDGALLDKLYLTKDGDTPTGQGAAVPTSATVVLEKTAAEKEILISEQLDKYITGLVGAAKNQVKAWDVVSEPMDDARPTELRKQAVPSEFVWQDYLGKDYAVKAIQLARKSGNAGDLLFFNETNLEQNLDKTKGLIDYITYVESKGVKVDGIGTRMNLSLTADKDKIASMFQLLAATGKLVRVSELNVTIAMPAGGKPTPEQYQAQRDLYKYVVAKYFELVPVKQRYGITIANPIDLGSSTQHSGLWFSTPTQLPQFPNITRKPAYAGFADGLKGTK